VVEWSIGRLGETEALNGVELLRQPSIFDFRDVLVALMVRNLERVFQPIVGGSHPFYFAQCPGSRVAAIARGSLGVTSQSTRAAGRS
jgi:hypothetical protein